MSLIISVFTFKFYTHINSDLYLFSMNDCYSGSKKEERRQASSTKDDFQYGTDYAIRG